MNNEQMSGRATPPPRGLPAPPAGRDFGEVFDNGLLRVEHDNYYGSLSGRPLKLPRKEFLIVSRLARNFDRIVASEEIWRSAWGEAAPFNSESLHVHIYRLRRRLEPGGLRVATMVGVGYRLTDAPAA
jgi:DNA-binding response OmpR family regulator